MDKCEKTDTEIKEPASVVAMKSHWVSGCPCCRGEGVIYFGEAYPTADQLRASKRDYRGICEADRLAETERLKDPAYREKIAANKEAQAEAHARFEIEKIKKHGKAIQAIREAIKKAERM